MDLSLLGQPVEPGTIARELKKLWESTGGTKSRASLVNLAVVCEGADALERNTQLISKFTRDHACRALLLAHVPGAAERRTQAWINAHCHLARAGAKQVCCEQVTFLIEGGSQEMLSNTLFANLDSDLPLYLWWQGEFPAAAQDHLWSRVDRLIFDSSTWSDPARQFRLLRAMLDRAGSHFVPCDLNWTRSLHLRQAVAQSFDHPENLAQIPQIARLALAHAPGHRSTALLFAAWIAAQLGWETAGRGDAGIGFRSRSGAVACELSQEDGAPIGRCELSTGDAGVVVHRDAGSPFLRAEVHLPEGRSHQHLLPAGADDLCSLLDEELTLGGRHRVYLKALGTLATMLG
jgi:glucose-6-phosphate dehydrogenase assembly protein OpcA